MRNASAARKNFGRHPKKTFSTKSAKNGHELKLPTLGRTGRIVEINPDFLAVIGQLQDAVYRRALAGLNHIGESRIKDLRRLVRL